MVLLNVLFLYKFKKKQKSMGDIKYQSGELSRLCGVSVRTIDHYEEIGLLKHASVDPRNGYRYYSSEQLLELCYIIWFKKQGLTLADIKKIFDSGTRIADVDTLEFRLHECEQEMEQLRKRYNILKSLIADYKKKENTTEIYLDRLPSIIVASYTMMVSNYDELNKQIMEVVVPEMLRVRSVIPHPYYCFSRETGKVSSDGKFEVEFCDEVLEKGVYSDIIQFKQLSEVPLAVCMKVYGSYGKLEANRIQLLAEIAQRGYCIVDTPRYNFVSGAWNQKNSEKWLTIIQIPVEGGR